MKSLSLGNTIEEKKETYALLSKKSKKWGKVFAILGEIYAVAIVGMLLSATESIFVSLILSAVILVACPIVYYWYGQIVYYGYLALKVYFARRNIGASEVAGAVGTAVLVSYIFGGKKATKKLGVMGFVILLIALIIGIFMGLYYYFTFRKEAKELNLQAA